MKAANTGIGLLLAALFAGGAAAETDAPAALWETAGFLAPESALFDPDGNVIYVSNVNGAPGDKDGNGFISRVGSDGTVQQLEWLKGMHAPKGMAIRSGRLYVADIDALLEIEIASGRVLNRYEDASAKFMNDVAAAPDGAIWVSDSFTNRLYRLKDGKFEVWLESAALDAPNGLYPEQNRIIVGTLGVFGEQPRPGSLIAVALADKSVSVIREAIGHLDAVETDGAGGWYLSDWPGGKVLHLAADGTLNTLLTLTPGTADMDVVLDSWRIYLPRMMDGKLAGYALPGAPQ